MAGWLSKEAIGNSTMVPSSLGVSLPLLLYHGSCNNTRPTHVYWSAHGCSFSLSFSITLGRRGIRIRVDFARLTKYSGLRHYCI
ncbi:uncharacterized protein DS421_5g142470 [Arachis hypogaea]|nr:uncharacterized protein DS421_5g142470 [Arachis hypogaea]